MTGLKSSVKGAAEPSCARPGTGGPAGWAQELGATSAEATRTSGVRNWIVGVAGRIEADAFTGHTEGQKRALPGGAVLSLQVLGGDGNVQVDGDGAYLVEDFLRHGDTHNHVRQRAANR